MGKTVFTLFFPFHILDITCGLNSLHMYTQWKGESVLTERWIFKHFYETRFGEGSAFFSEKSLELIWNPNSINLFLKLTHNHWKHRDWSVLAFHPLIRKKLHESTLSGTGWAGKVWRSLYVPLAEGHRSCVNLLKTAELAHMFRELTQGKVHQLCCALKRCWIMRWRMTHHISCPEWFLLRLLFLHSKFPDDRNTMAWVMFSWHIQITKSPWNNCKELEERCTKTNSECSQVVATSVEEDKWTDILMLELRSISIFALAVTKSQSRLFSLCGFVTAFVWHMYHTILISR